MTGLCAVWLGVVMSATAPKTLVVTPSGSTMSDAELSALVPGGPVEVLRLGDDDTARLTREAEVLHDAARRLALRLQSQEAIAQLERAAQLYGRALVDRTNVSKLAACLLDVGSAWLDVGQPASAEAAFRRAATLDPQREPDPDAYPPHVVETYHAVLAAQRGATGQPLTVLTTPSGAALELDGVPLGKAPLTLPAVVPGEHWLVARAPGFRPFVASYLIERGGTAKLDLFLAPAEGAGVLDLLGRDATSADQLPLRDLAGAHAAAQLVLVSDDGRTAKLWRLDDEVMSAALPIAAIAGASAGVPPSPEPVSYLVAALPLGLGQFAERRPLAGVLLLGSQLVLLAANVTSGAVLAKDRLPNGYYRHVERDRRLQVLNVASFGLLAGVLVVGLVDGLYNRPTSP